MKSPQEEIDRRVRERLLESNQTGGDWDLPSEKVWEDVEQRIQEQRRWGGAIWWMLGGMIVVVAAALLLFSLKERETETTRSAANTMSPMVEKMKSEPEVQIGETSEIVTNLESGGNRESGGNGEKKGQPEVGQPLAEKREEGNREIRENGGKRGSGGSGEREIRIQPIAEQPLTTMEVNTKATSTAQISSTNNITTSKAEPDLNSDQPQRENTIERSITGSSETTSESAINPLFPSSPHTSRAIVHLAFLQSEIDFQYNIDRTLPEIHKPPVMIPVNKPSPWSLAFVMTPALGTRRIVVPDAQPRVRRNLLLEQEEPAVQLGFGISAIRALNTNWSIVGGVEYNRFLLNSSTSHQVRYSRIGERLNGRGNYENDYRLNLSTSYGEVSTDVIVERSSDSQISEHQFINLSLQTRQAMQVLEFPVSLKYTLPMQGVNFSCYGGLSANVLLENSLEFRAVQSQNNEILQTRVARNVSLSGFRDFALGYQFGIGLEVPLQRQWSIIAGPSISGYLQPVYENRHVVIYPITFDLQVGVRYQL